MTTPNLPRLLDLSNRPCHTEAERAELLEAIPDLIATIETARELLDGAYLDNSPTGLYDDQGVNQAHRVLCGGEAPRKTAFYDEPNEVF
jgi:hypothetical protein